MNILVTDGVYVIVEGDIRNTGLVTGPVADADSTNLLLARIPRKIRALYFVHSADRSQELSDSACKIQIVGASLGSLSRSGD